MSQKLTLVLAFVVIGLIVAVCVGIVVRAKRRFKAGHPDRVEQWERAATELGVGWVVPVERVRSDLRPPALNGKVDGRVLYLSLRDDSVDEDMLPKWVIDAHVTLRHDPITGKEQKRALKRVRRGKRSEAKLQGKELRVQRRGLDWSAEELVGYAREVLAAAEELEGKQPEG